MKSLYLVDASNMFFRAFFAIPPLTNDKGMPTNALYGFLNMSLKLMRDVRPDYLVYCFDLKEPSFRFGLYPEYKANREEMPENLVPQIPYLKKLTNVLGFAQVEKVGYEADDCIGTLAMMGLRNKLETVIVSGDKDFAQLVQPGISLYDTMKDVRLDSAGVKGKFGVRPDQIIDYLAMVGDASDNVPGVRGIGPKGAEKLLADFETLEGVYKNIDQIKGAAQKKLIEGKDSAFLSQKLCTIVNDVDLNVELESLKLREPEHEPLRELLQELGFKTFEKTIFNLSGEASKSAPPRKPMGGQPAPAVKNYAAGLGGGTGSKSGGSSPTAPGVVSDTAYQSGDAAKPKPKRKTKSTKWVEAEWTLEDLKTKVDPYSEMWGLLSERGLYLGYDGQVLKVAADEKEIGKILGPKNLRWKGFNVKQVLKALAIPRQVIVWDDMLAAYIVRAKEIKNFEETYETYSGTKLPDLATPVDQITAHCELETILREKLVEREGLEVLERFELPLIPVLADMEIKGIALDFDLLKEQSQALNDDVRRLEKEIHTSAGETFNIGSPKQLGVVLFDKLKLPTGKKTKTGYSTDSDVLEMLAPRHPIAKLILEWRELSKIKSTYVDALPAIANPETHRVHTTMNQAATSTGRLSSTDPNLQNIPIRTERGRLVRKAFVAKKGYCLISADYSQIELRILAHITSDPGLTKAFKADLDIHTATASEVFNIPLKDVTSEHRRIAKAVNFGIAYGQGAFGLAETLGIPRAEATAVIGNYFTKFAGVKQYMENTTREGLEQGYVSTLFGRRRYIDELKSQNPNIRRAGERAAINAPIQGTASDLVKLAMIKCHESLPLPLLLQVHDELIFECPIGEADYYCKEIKTLMESVYPLNVPLKVNVASGPNWDDAH